MSDLRTERVVVAVMTGEGADLYFVIVVCSEEQYECGKHYDAAKDIAEADGFDAYLAFDVSDPPGENLMKLFLWNTASTVDISNREDYGCE